MHSATDRLAAQLAVAAVLALTVMPAFAADSTDRVTGGGWFEPYYFDATPNPPEENALPPGVEETSVFAAAGNTKCTFGFVAWRTPTSDPEVWDYDGELTFHDHGRGMKLKSVCVSKVSFPDAVTAIFEGMCEVRTADSAPQTTPFVVTVVVDAQPSAADWFQIALPEYKLPTEPEEYGAKGTLGGGSIQIH
jgi:hypothetical protein